jgi:hypothetical protein
MDLSNINIQVVNQSVWGNKWDPTEYDYLTQTIRIRDDYYKNMKKTDPLTHHWISHEYGHHIVFKKYGMEYVEKNSGNYPDNVIERVAFAYQFNYLITHKACFLLEDLFVKDPFFRHKKLYKTNLEYFWRNNQFILDEFNNSLSI